MNIFSNWKHICRTIFVQKKKVSQNARPPAFTLKWSLNRREIHRFWKTPNAMQLLSGRVWNISRNSPPRRSRLRGINYGNSVCCTGSRKYEVLQTPSIDQTRLPPAGCLLSNLLHHLRAVNNSRVARGEEKKKSSGPRNRRRFVQHSTLACVRIESHRRWIIFLPRGEGA